MTGGKGLIGCIEGSKNDMAATCRPAAYLEQREKEITKQQQALAAAYNSGYRDCMRGYNLPSLTKLKGFGNQGHYVDSQGVEAIDYILSNDLNFLEGNVVKYLARWRRKNGIEDLRKCQQYLLWLIEVAEQEEALEDSPTDT